MGRMCNNEMWLAAYIDRTLSEAERREYERHISRCPGCLADLIAAKADLDEVLGELALEAEGRRLAAMQARGGAFASLPLGALRIFSLFAPLRGSGRVLSASFAAFAVSLAIVAGFSALLLSPSWHPGVIAGKTYLARLLATTDLGDMRLAGSPRVPPVHGIVYRGHEDSSARLFELGLQALMNARDEYGGSPLICRLLGDLYLAHGDDEEAASWYRKELQSDRRDARALNGLAVAAYRRGDIAESRACLEKALDSRRPDADVYYNLAQLARHAGNTDEYRSFLTGYLERDSSSPLAEHVREILQGR